MLYKLIHICDTIIQSSIMLLLFFSITPGHSTVVVGGTRFVSHHLGDLCIVRVLSLGRGGPKRSKEMDNFHGRITMLSLS